MITSLKYILPDILFSLFKTACEVANNPDVTYLFILECSTSFGTKHLKDHDAFQISLSFEDQTRVLPTKSNKLKIF